MDSVVDFFKNVVFDPIHALEWTGLGFVGAAVGEIATTVFTLPFEPFFEENLYSPGTLMGQWLDHTIEAWGHVFKWD